MYAYIGKLGGLYPTNSIEAALCDEICDSVEDVTTDALRIVFGSKDAEDRKAQQIELCKKDGTLRYWLDKFLMRIEENAKRGNKNGLFVGDTLTIADLKFFQFEFYLIGLTYGAKDVFAEEKYKPLLNIFESVKKNDKIKEFLSEWENREYVKTAFEELRKAGILVGF